VKLQEGGAKPKAAKKKGDKKKGDESSSDEETLSKISKQLKELNKKYDEKLDDLKAQIAKIADK
jgi:hypothetical protein